MEFSPVFNRDNIQSLKGFIRGSFKISSELKKWLVANYNVFGYLINLNLYLDSLTYQKVKN